MFLLLIATATAIQVENPYSYNIIEITPVGVGNLSNESVNHSNSSDYWVTTDLGALNAASQLDQLYVLNQGETGDVNLSSADLYASDIHQTELYLDWQGAINLWHFPSGGLIIDFIDEDGTVGITETGEGRAQLFVNGNITSTDNVTAWDFLISDDINSSDGFGVFFWDDIDLQDSYDIDRAQNIQTQTLELVDVNPIFFFNEIGEEIFTFNLDNQQMRFSSTNEPTAEFQIEMETDLDNHNIDTVNQLDVEIINFTVGEALGAQWHLDALFGSWVQDMAMSPGILAFFDLRPKNTLLGVIQRESDGTGTAQWSNWYVRDVAGIDYTGFTHTAIASAVAPLIITGTSLGSGVVPDGTTQVQIDGDALLDTLNDEMLFGNNKDGSIYHDGSDFIIECDNYDFINDACRYKSASDHIFTSSDGTIIRMIFDGSASDGLYTWDSSFDRFVFNDTALFPRDIPINLGASGNWIMAFPGNTININALTDLNISLGGQEKIHINGTGVQVYDNFNQTNGNATINMVYGEMWAHNDTDYWVVDIVTQGVYVNVSINSTDAEAGQDLNGFGYNPINSSLIAQFKGKHDCSYDMSTGNAGNNQEYQFILTVNGIAQNNTDSHRKIGAAGDVGDLSDRGWIDLNVGDLINFQARNNDGTADLRIHAASVNCLRIGE